MKKIIIFFLFFIHFGFSQQEPELLSKLKQSFAAFEYEKTIDLADSLLLFRDSLSANDLVEVLRMEAIAQFALDDLVQAENAFLQILEIMPNFTLSESETSPKIIVFYDKIKLEYLGRQYDSNLEGQQAEQDQLAKMKMALADYKTGMLRSLVLPGWGHYYINESDKGLILNLGSLLTLAPGIYYAVQTQKYEKEYLNTTHEGRIESSYRRFNNAYKNRNSFLAVFAAIWLYSQYDYFFTDHETLASGFLISFNTDDTGNTAQFQLRIYF